MKKIFRVLCLAISFLMSAHIFAQQIFKDSGQRLGNSVSWDVKLGDLDGDGDLDAVVANWNFGDAIIHHNDIWLNDGHGIFSKSSLELNSCQGLILFDIDKDGDLDIIENAESITYMTPIKIWINDGKANFTKSVNYIFDGKSIVFDNKMNNDNQLKAITMATSGYNSGDSTLLRIYSIDNNSAIIEDTIIFHNFLGQGMTTGDLNNDGYSDLVLCQNGPNYILFNDKKGSFVLSDQQLLGTYNTGTITLGDLNGDGFSDILQGNYHSMPEGTIYPVKLYLNDKTGHFTIASLPYNSSYITDKPFMADLDNDGDLDIFLNHGHAFDGFQHKSEILFNDGHANFTSSTVNLENIKSLCIAPGDLDKDGDLDLYLACGDANATANQDRVWFNTINSTSIKSTKNGGFRIYPNPTSGQFTISFGTTPPQLAIVEIYNTEGKQILTKAFRNTTNAIIDLISYPKGIYIVKIAADRVGFEEKILKE